MDYVDLGKRIREKRREQKMTQEQLAAAIGVCTSFIGHIERGSRKASLETLVLLANTLHVSLDYLLSGSLTHQMDGLLPENASPAAQLVLRDIAEVLASHKEYLDSIK